MGKLKDYLVDKYLTWKTGKDKDTREWEAWYEVNVVYRASDIPTMFQHFKHIIEVDVSKFMDLDEPFGWVGPCEDAMQYFWPYRELGNNAVWRFQRVTWNKRDRHWHVNGLGDDHKVFVATNSDKDAMMIALKYMS